VWCEDQTRELQDAMSNYKQLLLGIWDMCTKKAVTEVTANFLYTKLHVLSCPPKNGRNAQATLSKGGESVCVCVCNECSKLETHHCIMAQQMQ
jgi:hypothetical protein